MDKTRKCKILPIDRQKKTTFQNQYRHLNNLTKPCPRSAAIKTNLSYSTKKSEKK